MEEVWPNSGRIFPCQKKSAKSPDLSGEAKVDGKEYRVSAWKHPSKRGEWIGLNFHAKDEQYQQKEAPQQQSTQETKEEELPL